jgi:ParB/RepB/Spo0J family partition protein
MSDTPIENEKSSKKQDQAAQNAAPQDATPPDNARIKTRSGSGYLKQLYSTARTSTANTHSNLRNMTTFLVNFVPVDKVDASELQVRVHFDDTEIEGLANSIKLHGVLQPILVVQNGDRYKVIAGERRLRASKIAGLERIPARVLSTDDKATHEIALRENLDRVDLHPLEEGEGYVSLLEAQAYTSHDSIAKAFAKPKSRITECIGFTRLPEATKKELLTKGVRSRSLLRKLLITAPEQHAAVIAEAAIQEANLDAGALPESPTGDEKLTATAPAPKREPKPFGYLVDAKGVNVPTFKWKQGEGPEKLQGYAVALRKLLDEIEERLTAPNT